MYVGLSVFGVCGVVIVVFANERGEIRFVRRRLNVDGICVVFWCCVWFGVFCFYFIIFFIDWEIKCVFVLCSFVCLICVEYVDVFVDVVYDVFYRRRFW